MICHLRSADRAGGLAVLAQRSGAELPVPYQINGYQSQVSGNIGVYLAGPNYTAAEALHFADQAMYVIRNAGPRSTTG